MSQTTTTIDDPSRPWHGTANPLESLHDWMLKEIEAVRSAASPAVVALEQKVAALEKQLAGFMKPAEAAPGFDASGGVSPSTSTSTSKG